MARFHRRSAGGNVSGDCGHGWGYHSKGAAGPCDKCVEGHQELGRRVKINRDAARFQFLQNLPAVEAQVFFWNYTSRKQRAEAIDKAMARAADLGAT
jgi:hypothetical protein